jgi:hypothetical protein
LELDWQVRVFCPADSVHHPGEVIRFSVKI